MILFILFLLLFYSYIHSRWSLLKGKLNVKLEEKLAQLWHLMESFKLTVFKICFRMLEQILNLRLIVKKALKDFKNDQVLRMSCFL